MKIEVKYKINQKVKVKELKLTGRITKIGIDADMTIFYQIMYIYNGIENFITLLEEDISEK